MISSLDPNGYARVQAELNKSLEYYRMVYTELQKAHIRTFEAEMDSDGYIQAYRQRVIATTRRLQAMQTEMKRYYDEYMGIQDSGSSALGQEHMGQHGYGSFDLSAYQGSPDLMAATYGAYKTYQFASAGKSFSETYNDLASFKQSQVYKDAEDKAGISEWNNWGLYVDTFLPFLGTKNIEKYLDGMLESAMSGILDGLPDVEDGIHFDGTFKELGSRLGIKNIDTWVKQLKSFLSKCASENISWELASAEPTFQMLVDAWPDGTERDAYLSMLKKVYDIQTAGKKVDAIMDGVKTLDVAIDALTHCFNDYSGQVAYLDSMQEALLNAGFANGPVHAKIDEMRALYLDEFKYSMREFSDYAKEILDGKLNKVVLDGASKFVPPLKTVDFGLKMVTGSAKILYADEISVYKGLAGLVQYDEALTRSYENYVQMMNDGIATAEDMAQADRIFEILRSTKAKEYEHMMVLCEKEDPKRFLQYYKKYYELTGKNFPGHAVPTAWEQLDLEPGSGRF